MCRDTVVVARSGLIAQHDVCKRFGQGNVNIQTDANVNIILDKYQDNGGGLGGLQAAVAPTKPGDVPLVGVVGGEGQLDDGFTGLLGNQIVGTLLPTDIKPIIEKVQHIDTTGEKK